MNDEPLLPDEEARLARARVPVPPPDGAGDRTVAVLRERGLLRPRRRPLAIAALAMAAAVLVAIVWVALPRRGDAVPPPAGPRYVLLLYAGTEPIGGSAETRRREYAAWARDVASRGVPISGEELAAESRALGGDAPLAPGLLPRGFFVVSAPDLDAVQQIAATCPHLRYGGRIVIQRIV